MSSFRCAFAAVGSLVILCMSCATSSASKGKTDASANSKSAQDTKAPKTPPTLFERLGGLPAIEAVVADFQSNVAQDPTINAPFAVADLKLNRKRLTEFVCMATGGPCTYTGRDMTAAHKGMRVTHAQFDSVVAALVKSLEKFKVPEQEKSELLGALGPMRGYIVEVD